MRKTIVLFFITFYSFAQNANRKYISHSWKNQILEIKTNDGLYVIKNYTNQIFETTFIPNGENFNPISNAVILKNKESDSVNFKVSQSELKISVEQMSVVIQFTPFQISYLYNEKKLVSEKNGYIKKDSTDILEFNLDKTEILFGGGARALGMNRRGNRLQLYNRAKYGYEEKADLMNFCIPLVLSSKIYALHFDNAAIGYLDLDSKKDNTLSYETISGRKTYQVIAGQNWAELMQNYTTLTGTQPLPALWTLGNFSSRFGYHSQDEVEKTIKKFNEEKIPVDAIILDLYWFGKTIKGTMGNLTWDKDNFPDPTKMIADLNDKGIKTIVISEPFILSTSMKWEEAVDKKVLATDKLGSPAKFDFYFGNAGIIDIFKPEGKNWFWNIYKNLINQGIGGQWGDLGEPEVFPSTAITAGGTADEVHNIYGENWAKLIAEGYKKDFPTVRPFILMRAGYSGSQRYGMIPWSGDVNRSWGGLHSQPEIALQMGMQGMAYMHSDLGGFAGDYFDNELYLRWLQYGVFQPVFRPHAQEEVASEAVYKDIVTKAKAKKLIELRYQMLPYNYTLAYENSISGMPLMRPLFFDEPNNIALLTQVNSYLWGNDFLVTTIDMPGLKTKTIYFPKNSNWYDFYSDKKYVGGTTKNIIVSNDYIPTFVRAGAFIPLIKTIQNTKNYSLENFDLHYYFDTQTKETSGKLYNDDGKSANSIENGRYEILNFYSKNENKSLTITLKNIISKSFAPTDKSVNLIIHNCRAKFVTVDEKKVAFKNFESTISFKIAWLRGTDKVLKIQF